MGVNHSFMEVPAGVDQTCLLLVFFFLTQITEEYLVVVMTVGGGGILSESNTGSILDEDNKVGVGRRSSSRYMHQRQASRR